MADEVGMNRVSPLGCVLRLLLAGVILAAASAAGLIFYRTWLGEGVDRSVANPALGQAQRFYLEYYLTQHASELGQVAGSSTEPQSFTISPGEGAAAIAANLYTAGLVADTELFLNYVTYYGLDSGLVAGQYNLDPRQTIPQLVEALGSRGARALELSFLPGWRSEEMANYLRVVSPARIDADTFLSIVQNPGTADLGAFTFLSSIPAGSTLEGYLFPGPYPIESTTDSVELVRFMLTAFDREVTPALRQAFGAQSLTLREALIVASIIEKEAALPEEKPLMAAVFLNRLRAGMPLQADPTVQYVVGYDEATGTWWKSPLDAADLAVESPYNTYQVGGLPPGPISNPGLASLAAVANPAAVDYLFFVLDCTADTAGQHLFSVTYEEHLANVERCR
jgi:UPF0755 protein